MVVLVLGPILQTLSIIYQLLVIRNFEFNLIYYKRKKLVKIISSSNVKITSVKILTRGKKIIVTAVIIITIMTSSGTETQKITKQSYTFSQNTQIERIIGVASGGAIDHLWSPRAKYESSRATRAQKASMSTTTKRPNLRRRLFSINSNSGSSKQVGNYDINNKHPAPSIGNSIPKIGEPKAQPGPGKGKGLRVRSIIKTDENGKLIKVFYDQEGKVIEKPNQSKLLDDLDLNLSSDITSDSPDPEIRSETKSQIEDVQNQNSGLIKARDNLIKVTDDKLNDDGDVVARSQLTPEGRIFVDRTRVRRTSPLVQSKYKDESQEFLPAYGMDQLGVKNKHSIEVLEELNKTITQYIQLPDSAKRIVDAGLVEKLLLFLKFNGNIRNIN